MAAKPPPYTTLQKEQADYQLLQQDSYPLQTQPRLTGYPPEQASYPPQQASYPPEQASYPPEQVGHDRPQRNTQPQLSTTITNRQQQPSIMNTACLMDGWASVTTVCPF
ncbi:uncharacterized protein LOC144658972 [Oculina patagonica]